MGFFLITMVDVQRKWKFYWHQHGDALTTKNSECKITGLQMLNNNYGNERLPQWNHNTKHRPNSGGCTRPMTLGSIFLLPFLPPGPSRRWGTPVGESRSSRVSPQTGKSWMSATQTVSGSFHFLSLKPKSIDWLMGFWFMPIFPGNCWESWGEAF